MSNGWSDRYSAARVAVAAANRKNTHPDVASFYHPPSHAITHIVYDRATRKAAIVDPVLDFDPLTLKTSTETAEKIVTLAKAEGLAVEWILETHIHDDHITAASYLKERLGAKIGIGAGVAAVQETWNGLLNLTGEAKADITVYDSVFEDGEEFSVGRIPVKVIATPGHTPCCVTYHMGDALFAGDTLFMPDRGTARADFPGGDSRQLYLSIQKLLALPANTRVFTGHDYPEKNGRAQPRWESTVAEQMRNIHVAGITEDAFTAAREARDGTLLTPPLLFHAVQMNIRAGMTPPAESNGAAYLKLPIT